MVAESNPAKSVDTHRQTAAQQDPIRFALVTVSDTRTPDTDDNGNYLQNQVLHIGHLVDSMHIVKDEPVELEKVLETLYAGSAHIIIFNGGTGIARRDRTFDVVDRHLEKTLPGFGEIFRMLSYEQVGAAAILSRATAGVSHGKVLFSLPGSPQAVSLAWEKLIAPECHHFAWELTR